MGTVTLCKQNRLFWLGRYSEPVSYTHLPLAHFAEGAVLAASVYLVSRGKRNTLKNSK